MIPQHIYGMLLNINNNYRGICFSKEIREELIEYCKTYLVNSFVNHLSIKDITITEENNIRIIFNNLEVANKTITVDIDMSDKVLL